LGDGPPHPRGNARPYPRVGQTFGSYPGIMRAALILTLSLLPSLTLAASTETAAPTTAVVASEPDALLSRDIQQRLGEENERKMWRVIDFLLHEKASKDQPPASEEDQTFAIPSRKQAIAAVELEKTQPETN